MHYKLSFVLSLSLSVSFISNRSEAKKTKVKRKTNNPQYDEVFYFEVEKPSADVFHDPLKLILPE